MICNFFIGDSIDTCLDEFMDNSQNKNINREEDNDNEKFNIISLDEYKHKINIDILDKENTKYENDFLLPIQKDDSSEGLNISEEYRNLDLSEDQDDYLNNINKCNSKNNFSEDDLIKIFSKLEISNVNTNNLKTNEENVNLQNTNKNKIFKDNDETQNIFDILILFEYIIYYIILLFILKKLKVKLNHY